MTFHPHFRLCIGILFFFIPMIMLMSNASIFLNVEHELVQSNEKMVRSSDALPYDPAQLSNYTLDVVVNETEASLIGKIFIDFYNDDPLSFTAIPLHIYLSGMEYETRPGSIQINDIYLANNHSQHLAYEMFNETQLMWVNLTESLEPASRVQFYIEFKSILPDGGIDRANVGGTDEDNNRTLTVAHFYPVPCVYDQKDGWNTDPYLNLSDPFYFDMAFYDLFIEAPKDLIIAATGELEEKVVGSTTTEYHFKATYPVREITFSGSRYYLIQSSLFQDINVSIYFLPQYSSSWNLNAMMYTIQSIDLYISSFGPYPYSTLNVVQNHAFYGGMEYPCQVYISSVMDRYTPKLWLLERVICHEVAHQWWYSIVGNDEVDEGFLDEGLTSWVNEYFYIEEYHPTSENFVPSLKTLVRHYAELNSKQAAKINQSVYECYASNTNFKFIAYDKASVVFEKLRDEIGSDIFLEALQQYYTNFQFKIATFKDLQDTFESVYGQSLAWFFEPWFNNDQLPRYSLNSAQYDPDLKILTINISDVNSALHAYTYHQQISLYAYTSTNTQIYSGFVWVNETETQIEISLDTIPGKVKMYLLSDTISETYAQDPVYYWKQVDILEDETSSTSSTSETTSEPENKISGDFSFFIFVIFIGVTVILSTNLRRYRRMK